MSKWLGRWQWLAKSLFEMRRVRWTLQVALLFAVCSVSDAVELEITLTGEVEFNAIGGPPLGNMISGDTVTVRFRVESDDFLGTGGATRAYPIDPSSFQFTFASSQLVGLGGYAPIFFVLRNDDPAVDGFFLSESATFPNGVTLDQQGLLGAFQLNPSITYSGDTLDSLDILDAVGDYDFTNLQVFNFSIDDGPFQAAGCLFQSMSIEVASTDPTFRRGDANYDGGVGLPDALAILNYGFGMSVTPPCLAALDVSGDGEITALTDALDLLNFLFLDGAPPPAPHPDCGVDPSTTQLLSCDALCL